MNNKVKTAVLGLTMLVVGAAFVPSAEAASIRLFDGTTTITINDNGEPLGDVADSNPVIGFVAFSGTIGVFNFVVASGQAFPLLGSLSDPEMQLNVIAVSNAPGTLTVSFSENGFGPSTGQFSATANGGTGGTVTYQTFQDPANVRFATTAPVAALGPLGPGFTGLAFGNLAALSAPYSLTQQLTITHPGAAATAVTANLQGVPDGGLSLGLLGIALMGIEGVRRKVNRPRI